MSGARLGVLVSGRGSNMVALADACRDGRIDGEVALVISSVPGVMALEHAARLGLRAIVLDPRGVPRAEHDARIGRALEDAGVTLTCLAGYMRLLTGELVRALSGRLVNIHPSLLPAFPGLHAQRQALEHGVKVAGCTAHFVDELLDHGPIILQEAVPVEDSDTEDALSARILAAEHRIFPRAVELVASGRVRLVAGRAVSG